MNSIRDLLQEADPLQVESAPSAADRGLRRQAILTAAATRPQLATESQSRFPIYLSLILLAIVVSAVGLRFWDPFVGNVQAAVRFEIRLAEQDPAPGLIEAKEAGGGTVYLHKELIATNSDIAQAQVIPQPDGKYAILVAFNPAGVGKVYEATEKNIGKRMAVLIDGKVVTAPIIQAATGEFAKIDSYAKEEAERIVTGMRIR
ncbi:MAG: hypothetical protein JXR49_09570 [Acidobacteria bacterium]|nr:hypothetical protein [Acidobacteriota bacterium]